MKTEQPTAIPEPEETEQEDFLAALMDAELDRKFEAVEETGWKRPGYDPLKQVAVILEKGRRKYKTSELGNKVLSNVLVSYLAGNSSASAFASLMQRNGDFPSGELAGIILASEAVHSHITIPRMEKINSFSDYLKAAGKSFGEKLEKLFSLKIKEGEFEIEAEKEENETPEDNMPYQLPAFTGFNPETLIAANAVCSLLNGYDERLKYAKDREELAKLVFIEKSSALLPKKESLILLKKAKEEKENLNSLVVRALVSLAIMENKELAGLDADNTVSKYEKIMKSVYGYSQSLAVQLDELKGFSAEYEGIAMHICNELEKRRGIVFYVPQIENREKFERLKKQLLSPEQQFFEIIKDDTEFERGDYGRAYKALEGDRYADGKKVEGFPIGTVGKMYDNEIFADLETNRHFVPARGEIQKLRKVIQTTEPKKGFRAEVINDGRYTITKNGSWGYIVEETGEKYNIKFEHLTNDYHPLRQTFPIFKKDVKVDFPKEFKEKIEKQTKGLVTDIETIVKNAEAEVRAAEERKMHLVESGAANFRAMGIDDGIARLFFDLHLDEPEEFAEKGLLSEKTILHEIKELQAQISNPKSISEKIRENIEKEIGVIFNYAGKIDSQKKYDLFRQELEQKVMEGYRVAKGKKKFKEGDFVMVPEGHGYDFPFKIIARYRQKCGDNAHHLDFPGQNDVHIEKEIVAVVPAYDLPKLPDVEMKSGTRVRIRKDSKFYGQNDGIGVMNGDFGSRGTDREGAWTEVIFEDGYEDGYTKKDLEPVNPLELITKAQLRKHRKSFARINKIKQDISARLSKIVEKAEEEYKGVEKRLYETSGLCVTTLRAMGVEDNAILSMFKKSLSDISYLDKTKLFDY